MVMKHLEKRLDDILENYIIQEVYTVSPTVPEQEEANMLGMMQQLGMELRPKEPEK